MRSKCKASQKYGGSTPLFQKTQQMVLFDAFTCQNCSLTCHCKAMRNTQQLRIALLLLSTILELADYGNIRYSKFRTMYGTVLLALE